VDDLPVVGRVHHGHDGAGQAREVLRTADLGEALVLLEARLERDRVGDRVARGELAYGLVDARMPVVGEMLRQEELADALVGLVVRQQGAEELLLRLDVDGWRGCPAP
jgi:hypothetical protein